MIMIHDILLLLLPDVLLPLSDLVLCAAGFPNEFGIALGAALTTLRRPWASAESELASVPNPNPNRDQCDQTPDVMRPLYKLLLLCSQLS